MRLLLRSYLIEVNKSRKMQITDMVKFAKPMEFVGLTVYSIPESITVRSFVPDGNVLALCGVLAVVFYMTLK